MTYAKRTGPVLLVVLLCLGCMVGKPSVPYQGTLTDMPVKRPVTVVRDTQGVPHIYASNACDLYFGLGYTMAQDRLFQMDTYRHVALGRLSEWFGNLSLGQGVSLVQVDMLLKCFDLERHTAQAAAGLRRKARCSWNALSAVSTSLSPTAVADPQWNTGGCAYLPSPGRFRMSWLFQRPLVLGWA